MYALKLDAKYTREEKGHTRGRRNQGGFIDQTTRPDWSYKLCSCLGQAWGRHRFLGLSSSLTGLAKMICCRNHGWARSVSPKALERTKQDSRNRGKALHSVLRMLWKELWEILLTQ